MKLLSLAGYKTKIKSVFFLFAGFFAILLLGFCSSPPQKRFYSIETDTKKITKGSVKIKKLKVNKLKILTNYEGKEFVYKKKSEYESDYYNQFLVPPATNITDQLVNWLGDSGFCGIVLNRIGSTDSNIVLDGSINALYADISDQKAPKVIVEIEIYLLDNLKDTILFTKKYSRVKPFQEYTSEGLINAYNEVFTEIFYQLENDMRKEVNPVQ